MKLLEEIVFSYARVQRYEPGLIRIEILSDAFIGQAEALELNRAIGILTNRRQSLVVIVADELSRFKKTALEYALNEQGLCYATGAAMVLRSVAQRITANFYLLMNEPVKPCRIFNCEKEALSWLFTPVNAVVS